MDSTTWLLVVSAIVLCLSVYYKKKRHSFKDWGIPQPFEVPYLGSVPRNLWKNYHLSDLMKDMYNFNKEAKYVGMHTFMIPVIIITDIDLVKTVLIKEFDHFADHRELGDAVGDPLLTKNLIAINGDKWRELRQLLSPAFTSSKMKLMFELMSDCADRFAKSFSEQFLKEDDTDMKKAFTKYTNDVIATCAFGIEIDSMKNPDNEFYRYGREVTNTDGLAQLRAIYKMLFMIMFPRFAKFIGMELMREKISKFFIGVIDEAIKQRDEKGTTRPDMLQLMMDARDKNSKLDLVEMTAQAFLFFVAGFETASSNMSLMAHEIAVNPDVQEKLHAEIDEVSEKSGDKVTYEAIANMPYLDAVFQETLRLHPQLAFLSRVCSKTFELPPALPGAKPYVMKVGEEIMIPVTGIHQDPTFFEEPTKFNPERFLEKKITTTGDPKSLGFGMGPRMCIGNRFAILETKVLFFYLLRKHTLQPCSKTCLPLKYHKFKVGPIPKEGFWLRVRER
ncbi:hypothetical protein TSAR_010092 [Trichomalopsis sarcophagae]|uniref:Cytochrome P450 n=1 Tax=Trichomalopsis sarcophagae TaxID=543379 RepID=A0A232EQY5_9HYME|nr:hypothetical protein TSAR_010092 [Trichomalopsis sarcophagae]